LLPLVLSFRTGIILLVLFKKSCSDLNKYKFIYFHLTCCILWNFGHIIRALHAFLLYFHIYSYWTFDVQWDSPVRSHHIYTWRMICVIALILTIAECIERLKLGSLSCVLLSATACLNSKQVFLLDWQKSNGSCVQRIGLLAFKLNVGVQVNAGI